MKSEVNKEFIESKRVRADVSAYLKFFPMLEDLESKGLLKIDLRRIYVSIDYRLHMEFMADDQKYMNFFTKIRALMNFRRGFLQVKKVLQSEDRIDFCVFRKHKVYMDDNQEVELKDIFNDILHLKIEEKEEILLVGYVEGEKLDYTKSIV